ncbi:MAG: TonB-dependent receptor [Balneolaceae bacterium]
MLSGNVTDEATDEPLHGATVYIPELQQSAVTDSAGYYSITILQGEYLVRYQFLRMITVEEEIIIYSSGEFNVTMQEQEFNFDEIIVEVDRFGGNVRNVATGVEVVTITNLEQLPVLMGEVNVIQSLKSLTGVGSVGDGATGYNVRGGREDQNLILMDGAPVLNSTHVLGLFSIYNPDVTESYSLFKGHMPERFGGHLSSVLDVKMKRGSDQEFKVKGGVGLFAGRLMAEGPLIKDKTTFLIAGRTSWAGWILNMGGDHKHFRLPLNPDVANSTAGFYDFNVKVNHRLNPKNSLNLSAYGSKDDFRFSDNFGYGWRNRIAGLSWRSELSDNLFLDLSAGANQYSSSHFTPSGVDAFQVENGVGNYKLKTHLLYIGLDNHTLNAGIELNRYHNDDEVIKPYHETSAVAPGRVEKDHGQALAFYMGDEIDITPGLSLSLGIRASTFSQLGPGQVFGYEEGMARSQQSVTDTTHYTAGERIATYRHLEPRISTRYLVTPSSSVRLSYNRTVQHVHQVSNSATSTPADIRQPATEYLPPQSANNYTVGYNQNLMDDLWETSLELYYRDLDNLVEYVDFAELFMNEHLETELVSAKGRSQGAEFSVNKTAGTWTGYLSYTYVRTFVRVSGEQAVNRGEWFPSGYDQPHNLDLIVKRRLGEKSAFSFNFTWHTGRPITGLVSSYRDGTTTVPVFSDRNDKRIPDYVRLDISFTIAENIWKDRVVDPDRRYKDTMNITFFNVLGRKNAFSVFYQRPSDAVIPKAKKLSVLGAMIPSVTYNFSF